MYAVAGDLPFAQSRWCGAEGVENVTMLSDYRDHALGRAWGLSLKEMGGLLARAVYVIERIKRHVAKGKRDVERRARRASPLQRRVCRPRERRVRPNHRCRGEVCLALLSTFFFSRLLAAVDSQNIVGQLPLFVGSWGRLVTLTALKNPLPVTPTSATI